MKEYSMELCGVKRTLPFIPISEEMAFASFVVLGDTELVSACAPELAAKIEADTFAADFICVFSIQTKMLLTRCCNRMNGCGNHIFHVGFCAFSCNDKFFMAQLFAYFIR